MANPDIRHHASKGGRAAARRRLTLDRVERELPLLDSVDSAMQRLDRLGLWITAGMLTGSAGSGVSFKGPVYGTDVNLPIPQEEENNGNFTGCLDRGV